MTSLGKLLVLLNVGLSLGIAGLAFGVYTNRVDWPGTAPAAAGEKTVGEFAQKKAELEDAKNAADIALTRLEEAQAQLTRLEERRPKDQALYAKQLELLEGKEGQGNIQVLTTRTVGAGRAVLDEDGLPILEPPRAPARPLQSVRAYHEELASTENKIANKIDTVTSLVKQQQDLTQEINGVAGRQKGLRDLLAEEIQAREKAHEELESVRPLRYNRQVESELLQKRQQSLQARLQELKNIGMAFRQP
jgi:DNA repair ATPase RecN